MNHYQKIAVVIFRVSGCCIVIYGVAWVFYSVAHNLLLEDRGTSLVSTVTNLLWCITFMLAGAIMYVLSRPLAYLVARKLKSD